ARSLPVHRSPLIHRVEAPTPSPLARIRLAYWLMMSTAWLKPTKTITRYQRPLPFHKNGISWSLPSSFTIVPAVRILVQGARSSGHGRGICPADVGLFGQDRKRQEAQIFSDTGCKRAGTLLTLPDGKHSESSFWIPIMARSRVQRLRI